MKNRAQLEKAIPICKKSVATAEEILKGCGGVCQIALDVHSEKDSDGLLSCSIGFQGHCLAVCIWKDRDNGRFEKVCHFTIGRNSLILVESFVSTASHLGSETSG